MEKYIKQFDTWNRQKKLLDSFDIKKTIYFKEREIWWTSIGVNVGSEIDGKNELFERPVLIVKKLSSNKFFGVPLSSKEKQGTFFVPISYGITAGIAVIVDFRALSTKRLLRKVGKVNNIEFDRIKETFNQLISR